MLMGYKNSPMIMQRTLNKIFEDMLEIKVLIYLDDIVIFGKNREDHKRDVEEAIRRLEKNKFRVNPKKYNIVRKK